MIIIKIILVAAALYLLFGLLFAFLFIWKGVGKIDEGAHGGSMGFRIIILPGTMVFWPLLLKKWLKASKQINHDQTIA